MGCTIEQIEKKTEKISSEIKLNTEAILQSVCTLFM